MPIDLNVDSNFKVVDARSYDSVVTEFDRYTEQCTAPLAERLLSLAKLAPGQSVLDIGTGTGVLALRATQSVGVEGCVTGIDLSEGMLAEAQRKAEVAGIASRVDFRRMDAEALGLPDRSFDVVVSLFALLHFPNPAIALQEMYRVLRPDGRLVLGIGSGPPLFSWKGIMRRIARVAEISLERTGLRATAPQFLNLLVEQNIPGSRNAEETEMSRHSLNRIPAVLQLIREEGFVVKRTSWERNVIQLLTAEDFWELQMTFSSLARKRIIGSSPESIAALRDKFLTACRRVQARGGKLVYPSAAYIVVAERP